MSQTWNEQNRNAQQSDKNRNQAGQMPDDQAQSGKDAGAAKQTEQSQRNIGQQGADQVDKDAKRSDASRRAEQGVTGEQPGGGDQENQRNP